MTAHEYLWIDLATTGVNPYTGELLEFAVVLCEDGRGDDFAITQQYTGVIHHSKSYLGGTPIDDYVDRMHKSSGLWADVEASTTTTAEVDAFLEMLAESLAPGRHNQIRIAGSGVHFDLAWSRVHLPRFAERLSHRILDVSSVCAAVLSWGTFEPIVPPKAQRALDDIFRTIAIVKNLKQQMGWEPK